MDKCHFRAKYHNGGAGQEHVEHDGRTYPPGPLPPTPLGLWEKREGGRGLGFLVPD